VIHALRRIVPEFSADAPVSGETREGASPTSGISIH